MPIFCLFYTFVLWNAGTEFCHLEALIVFLFSGWIIGIVPYITCSLLWQLWGVPGCKQLLIVKKHKGRFQFLIMASAHMTVKPWENYLICWSVSTSAKLCLLHDYEYFSLHLGTISHDWYLGSCYLWQWYFTAKR